MSDIPQVKNPRYINFDLGRYSDELAGQSIKLLQNPSRGFKQSYVRASFNASVGLEAKAFLAHLAVVLGVEGEDAVQAQVDDLPEDAFQWLFLYTLDGWDAETKVWRTLIRPHLVSLWDDYVTEQVKARAAQGEISR